MNKLFYLPKYEKILIVIWTLFTLKCHWMFLGCTRIGIQPRKVLMLLLCSVVDTINSERDYVKLELTASTNSLCCWRQRHNWTQGHVGMSTILVGTTPFGGYNMSPLIWIGSIYRPVNISEKVHMPLLIRSDVPIWTPQAQIGTIRHIFRGISLPGIRDRTQSFWKNNK